MSCYNNDYFLNQPFRTWSRVQNSCLSAYNATNPNALVQIPYTNELVTQQEFAHKINMIRKGNILQYKQNSNTLTKQQKYSLIANGKWINRHAGWASQSTKGYTNPNNASLKRVGGVNMAYDPNTLLPLGPTTEKITCPKQNIIINHLLPTTGSSSSLQPAVLPPPPPPPTVISGTDIPMTNVPTNVVPIIIQDEGFLVCNVKENVCTGETTSISYHPQCNPTTDSNVPGPIQNLCWDSATPTWYDKPRYVMTNGNN